MEEKVEKMSTETIENLLGRGIIKIAQRPKANPKEVPSSQAFAIFLSEEDYPALTPAMWNKTAEKFGLNFQIVMLVASPSNLSEILQAIKAEPRLKGGVFGVGFKDEAIAKLDKLDRLVAIAQSANVFVRHEPGEIEGFNTDAVGFVRSLEEKLEQLAMGQIAGKKIVILGAGGTGAAIAALLPEKGVSVMVLNRTVEKATDLAKRINNYYGKEVAYSGGEALIEQEISSADVVINATTKGAAGAFANFSAFTPAGGEWSVERNKAESERILRNLTFKPLICDIVLVGGNTPTISIAKKFGLPTLDGRPMNLYQAIPAIKLVFPQVVKISDSQIESTMRAAQLA